MMHRSSVAELSKPQIGLRSAEKNVCLVLRYCRVARLCHDPLQLAVEPCNFESHMEYLQDSCNVISLEDIGRHLEQRKPFPPRTVAVTFDCGYQDTLHVAKKVLQRLRLRATVFAATTNMVLRGKFWWDELEDLIIPERTRSELEIEIDGGPYFWPLDTARNRFAAFEEIYSLLAGRSSREQQQLLQIIRQGAGRVIGEYDCHSTLTAQDLHLLEHGGTMDVGGHSFNSLDACLSAPWELDDGISRNKLTLEEILGHAVTYISHTFGGNDTHHAVGFDIIRGLGYNLGFGDSYGGINPKHTTDFYDLPRVKVRNWQPFAFHQFLNRFFK